MICKNINIYIYNRCICLPGAIFRPIYMRSKHIQTIKPPQLRHCFICQITVFVPSNYNMIRAKAMTSQITFVIKLTKDKNSLLITKIEDNEKINECIYDCDAGNSYCIYWM